MTEKPDIRQARNADLPKLWAMVQEQGQQKDPAYFERAFKRQEEGELTILIAALKGVDVGYVLLNQSPKYTLYKKLGIPEIQDLNILLPYRRQGLATHIIHYCEEKVRQNAQNQIGIAVSVHGSFGPAQRLYVKLGYIPDGQGVSHDRKPVNFASLHPVDDQLCLMMVKEL